jgi:gamma-glutamyltranspeptidase/glutathione hydrolase
MAYRAKEREPLCQRFMHHNVCTAAPPKFGGIALLQQLALLEQHHVADLAPDALAIVHLFLEVGHLARADR